MCLGIPGKVVEIKKEQQKAVVETFGLRKEVGIFLVSEVRLGDYLMVHAGNAIEILDLVEAEKRLQLWEEILTDADVG